MKHAVFLFAVVAIFGVCLRGEEVLLTTSGKFATQTGAIAIEAQTTPENHIKYTITFKQKKQVANLGEVVSKKEVAGEIPITVGEWAICLSEPDEVWIYLGRHSYTLIKSDGQMQCLSPELVEGRAPATLKRWIKTRPN